ncbi:hypothetical protein [Proteus vulgaris]|uniref:Uncharacterized protein n=1 Tax=Proteus vulgaris TaxID=585 RepID=A0A6G6SGB4_PROVU|nr:hypothetical protein [Proteus vulgaris]QIF93565.1 hypothetical protein GTH24_06520 [Proteus vulgaris]WIF73562.1 hypothetical protein QN092_06710 [Proteus vulgaris]CRL63927.1 hypothetical protein BN1805_02546 [Proteus vulgaris]
MNVKQENKKLLTFASPLLSLTISLYISISTFGCNNIIWLAISSVIFFIAFFIFISSLEISIKIIYFKELSFLYTNKFVILIFTLMSFIATAIVLIIIFHEEKVPSVFFNSVEFIAFLIAYFSFLLVSIFVSFIYCMINSNKKFLLLSLLLLLTIIFFKEKDINFLIFYSLIFFIIFFGAITIITIRKTFSNYN